MPTLETHDGYYLWHYVPNIGAAIFFTILFVVLSALHLWRMVQTRMWFCTPFVVGGFFEVIGYIGRASAYTRTGELIPYLIQSIFLLLAPVLFAATLYMILGRLVRAVQAEPLIIIPPRWLTKIFVGGDVFSFFVQGGGAGLLASASDAGSKQTGEYVIIGGLILQVIMFGVFVVTALHFNMAFRRRGGGRTERWAHVPWQGMLNMLYVTSAFIMVRNVFRVVEFGIGNDGYLLSTEWPLYVFDGLLMLFTMCWFLWRYPSEIRAHLPRPEGMTELTSADGDSVAQLRAERRKLDRA